MKARGARLSYVAVSLIVILLHFIGKKGKKQKGKTLNLSEFLAENDGGIRSGQAVVMAPSKSSWADEMDDGNVLSDTKL